MTLALLLLSPLVLLWWHARRVEPGRLDGVLRRAHEQRRHEDRTRDREMGRRWARG